MSEKSLINKKIHRFTEKIQIQIDPKFKTEVCNQTRALLAESKKLLNMTRYIDKKLRARLLLHRVGIIR